MKSISGFQFFKMTWFDQPACDRTIYKLIRKREVRSIVEFGLGEGTRCEKMLSVADTYNGDDDSKIKYTGIDLFDAREGNQTPLKLIEMHRRLKSPEVKTQLVPGTVGNALPRIANAHASTDLILFSAGYDQSELDATISFLPRMLHDQSLVLFQDQADGEFEIQSKSEIERIAQRQPNRKAA